MADCPGQHAQATRWRWDGLALYPQVIHTSTAGMVGPGLRNPGESTPTIVYRSLLRRRLRPRTPAISPIRATPQRIADHDHGCETEREILVTK